MIPLRLGYSFFSSFISSSVIPGHQQGDYRIILGRKSHFIEGVNGWPKDRI